MQIPDWAYPLGASLIATLLMWAERRSRRADLTNAQVDTKLKDLDRALDTLRETIGDLHVKASDRGNELQKTAETMEKMFRRIINRDLREIAGKVDRLETSSHRSIHTLRNRTRKLAGATSQIVMRITMNEKGVTNLDSLPLFEFGREEDIVLDREDLQLSDSDETDDNNHD